MDNPWKVSIIIITKENRGMTQIDRSEECHVRLIRKIKDGKFDVDKDNENGDYDAKRLLKRLERLLLPVCYEEEPGNH